MTNTTLQAQARDMIGEFRLAGQVRRTLAPRSPFVIAASQWKRPILHMATVEVEYEQHDNDPQFEPSVWPGSKRNQVQVMCKSNIATKNARWHDEVGEFQVCVTCAHRAEQKRFEAAAMANPSPVLLRERVESLLAVEHG